MTFAPLAAWPGASVLGPMAGGARSRLWRVDLAGAPCVARKTGASEAALRWLTVTQRLAERAGIVTAPLIATATGALSAGGLTLEPLLAGHPGTRGDLAALRPALTRFHRLARHLPERPGHPPLSILAQGLPPNMARAIRASLPRGPVSAIHGDLHPGNLIRLTSGRIALIDWEESRRDLVALDPPERGSAAHIAYEIAAGWHAEPARARGMARRLRRAV